MKSPTRKTRSKKTPPGGARPVTASEGDDTLVAFAHVHARPVRNPKKTGAHSDRHWRSGKASTVSKWEAIDARIKPIAERLKAEGRPLRKWAAAIAKETGFDVRTPGLDVRTIRTHLHALGYRPQTKKRT